MHSYDVETWSVSAHSVCHFHMVSWSQNHPKIKASHFPCRFEMYAPARCGFTDQLTGLTAHSNVLAASVNGVRSQVAYLCLSNMMIHHYLRKSNSKEIRVSKRTRSRASSIVPQYSCMPRKSEREVPIGANGLTNPGASRLDLRAREPHPLPVLIKWIR